MKKFLPVTIAALFGILIGAWIVKAQSSAPFAIGIGPTQVVANCPTPVVGTTFYCFAFDKEYQSQNGAAYAVYGAAAGVVSVQQCNLAGTNCGAVQTGAAVIKTPQTVTVTVAN